jgi:hypothetical protein
VLVLPPWRGSFIVYHLQALVLALALAGVGKRSAEFYEDQLDPLCGSALSELQIPYLQNQKQDRILPVLVNSVRSALGSLLLLLPQLASYFLHYYYIVKMCMAQSRSTRAYCINNLASKLFFSSTIGRFPFCIIFFSKKEMIRTH